MLLLEDGRSARWLCSLGRRYPRRSLNFSPTIFARPFVAVVNTFSFQSTNLPSLTSSQSFFRMPSTTTPPPELEVLTFLSDPNAQVRQVALSNIVGFSAKDSPHRSLLISKHKNRDGSPLLGRDGKEVDTVEDLKRLCQDQPVSTISQPSRYSRK